MNTDSLHNRVSVPKEFSNEQKQSVYEHARRALAYDLMRFLDKQKSRIAIEIKEKVYSDVGLFGDLEDVFEIWVEVYDINARPVMLINEPSIQYNQTNKTIFGKINDYLRKVSAARKYHWEM